MPKFYNIEEIFQKVLKIYTSGKVWKDFIVSENLFPLEIKLKKVKQIDIRDNYSQLIKELNSLKKEVFEMEYQEFHFKSLGTQKLPIVIHFRERKDFLSYISKEREFEEFVSLYQHIVLKYPLLKTTLLEKPSVILENSTRWDKLFLVYDFFIKTPQVNIYIRELNIEGIDTKFIERNRKILDSFLTILLDRKDYKEEIKTLSNYGFEKKYFFKYPQPLIRFRILDTTQTIGGLSDISTPVNEFKSLELLSKNIFIVENKITTLSFPPLKNSTVIFGSGYGVEVLKNVDWLEDKNIFYWGDIDSDGFAILSQIRGYFNHIQSIFMDSETIKLFSKYQTIAINQRSMEKTVKNLTDEERRVFLALEDGFRLEQERLNFGYVKEVLEGLV